MKFDKEWRNNLFKVIVMIFAIYGFFTLLHRISPCRVQDNCFDNSNPDYNPTVGNYYQ